MGFKDKITLAIIFIFIIYIFIQNKDFIIFTIGLDLNKCYKTKRCKSYLQNNYKKNK